MRSILETLRRETESTIRTCYALQQCKLFLVSQDSVNKINENVFFWIMFERSLLAHLFIGIRRLFESKRDTFNFQRALNMIKERIDDFSPISLEQRKLAGLRERPEWIDAYIAEAYAPTIDDFNALAKLARSSIKRMKGVYIDAANKIFAHAVLTDMDEINNLLAELNLEEIDTALSAIWHFYEQVWQMYENGRPPSLEISQYPHKDEVQQSIIKQLGITA